jgi:hypothetical protein
MLEEFNGLGYLYVKGYGVDKRNYTKVTFASYLLGLLLYLT